MLNSVQKSAKPACIIFLETKTLQRTPTQKKNWRCEMQKYLYYGSYTPQGYKGLIAEGGSKRNEAVKLALESIGGSLESFYFSFGEHDFYVIINLPDNVNAAAFSLAACASGAFTIKTVALLTPAEIDKAVKVGVNFRLPGQ